MMEWRGHPGEGKLWDNDVVITQEMRIEWGVDVISEKGGHEDKV